VFKERHEITEVIAFWMFIFTECFVVDNCYCSAIRVTSDTRVCLTHGMFRLYTHRNQHPSLSSVSRLTLTRSISYTVEFVYNVMQETEYFLSL
jgi:hypothetical protein